METVNNIAAAASKAIWGEGTTNNETGGVEPVSGQTGNVEAGEPYDKGNEATSATSTSESKLPTAASSASESNFRETTTDSPSESKLPNTTSSTSASDSTLPTYLNYQKGDSKSTDTPGTNPSSTTDNTTPTANTGRVNASNNTGLGSSSIPDPAPATSHKPSSEGETSAGDAGAAPSVVADLASSQSKATHQGAGIDREPSTSETEKIKETKDRAEDSATKNEEGGQKDDGFHNPDHPGIKEVHSGKDAGAKYDTFQTQDGPHIGDQKSDGRIGPDVPKGTKVPGATEEEEKVERKTETGQHGVHSTGTGAGGGHVDATNHEANHLREAKGVDHPANDLKDVDTSRGTESLDHASKEDVESKEKLSLKDKIKAKLHKDKS